MLETKPVGSLKMRLKGGDNELGRFHIGAVTLAFQRLKPVQSAYEKTAWQPDSEQTF
jgi:hypothetical protein